jgi:menaquinone-dependent protoporphyrinogen oxidase
VRVIIVVGSKHGSTSAIAAAVGEELRHGGLEVSVTDADDADVSLDGFDAAVIGSAVYVGRWMKDARNFLEANRERLRGMPLWLFSSGPLGDRVEPADDLADVQAFAEDLQARDHRVFAGKLDKAGLSLAERAAVRMVHAPYGDVRDWSEIRSWAKTIVAGLTDTSGSTTASAVTTAPS